jgi:hypothetical protein
MSELTTNDYKKILHFYNEPIPKTKELLKAAAETILSNKLCRCIKKTDKKNEARAIGICTKTIINNKGYRRGRFTCKKEPSIKLYKTKKNNKTKRRINK